jgi:acyl-CoA synthetase (AMP-forming)/AMP-acid ligase II
MTLQISSILRRAEQVAPNTTATIHLERKQTWTEFLMRVQKLAGAFRNLGIEAGDRIAILFLNSDRYVEYFYSTVWSGAAMMPMNIRWTLAECAFALNDAGAEVLIVDDSFAKAVPAIEAEVPDLRTVIFSGDNKMAEGVVHYNEILTAANPVEDAGRGNDDLAGIFYTGGTTGFPKGVMLSHLNFYVSGISNAQELRLRDGSVYLHAAPMFHIADLLFFVATTFVSGTHVSIPMFTPEGTLDAMDQPTSFWSQS